MESVVSRINHAERVESNGNPVGRPKPIGRPKLCARQRRVYCPRMERRMYMRAKYRLVCIGRWNHGYSVQPYCRHGRLCYQKLCRGNNKHLYRRVFGPATAIATTTIVMHNGQHVVFVGGRQLWHTRQLYERHRQLPELWRHIHLPRRVLLVTQPSLPTIIQSRVGEIAVQTISVSESSGGGVFVGNLSGTSEFGDRLLDIWVQIQSNPSVAMSVSVSDEIKRILKSCSLAGTEWLWVNICRKFPALWEEMETDTMIKNRAEHIRKIGRISEMFSEENLVALDGGIQSVRRRLFESVED